MDVGSRSITTTMPRLWPHSRVQSIQRQNEACDPAAHSRLRPAIQAGALEWLFMLRVFGRLPVSGVTRCSEAGVRKASGEETAGEFAPAVVSVYGDLACVCPDLWISNGDHGRVIIVALALVAACRIGTVVL